MQALVQAAEEWLAFVRWLNEVSSLPAGYRLQLPSEPEWEKGARGGLEVVMEPEPVPLTEIVRPSRPPALQPNKLPRRRFPWGDEPDPQRANYDDTRIGSTSAVGCFAQGVSPYGAEEMSGNVWEWTRSRDAEYPYPAGVRELAHREDPAADGNTRRVLRGGAFNNYAYDVRCAARFRNYPSNAFGSFGFRVVLSPFTFGLWGLCSCARKGIYYSAVTDLTFCG